MNLSAFYDGNCRTDFDLDSLCCSSSSSTSSSSTSSLNMDRMPIADPISIAYRHAMDLTSSIKSTLKGDRSAAQHIEYDGNDSQSTMQYICFQETVICN